MNVLCMSCVMQQSVVGLDCVQWEMNRRKECKNADSGALLHHLINEIKGTIVIGLPEHLAFFRALVTGAFFHLM